MVCFELRIDVDLDGFVQCYCCCGDRSREILIRV